MRTTAAQSGFTLVEMAMVMVIIGLVILTVLPALNVARTANQKALTQSNLHSLMLATASYVQANGCLPCPANPGLGGGNFGRIGLSTSGACGTCAAPEGIVPFVSLGIPQAVARDGWGHWITMRVDPALTLNFGVTPPWAQCQCSDFSGSPLPTGCSSGGASTTPSCTVLGASQKGMCRSGLAAAGRVTVTVPNGTSQQAAVIFISHGSTGYGSYFAQAAPSINNGYALPFPGNYASCASGDYALCNGAQSVGSITTTQTFYDAPQTISNTAPYDDILAYADRNTLVSMLGNPGCSTVW